MASVLGGYPAKAAEGKREEQEEGNPARRGAEWQRGG